MRGSFLTLFLLVTALPAVAAPSHMTGFRADLVADLDEVQDKILRLAAQVPAEKYTWRPAPGVRSVSEVFMHIAGGNYFLGSFIGPAPAVSKDLERITDKSVVQTELRKSFDYLRGLIANERDADLDKTVKMFGAPVTQRFVFLTIVNHLHEHLGQSIAYARMNGVVPPWSQ